MIKYRKTTGKVNNCPTNKLIANVSCMLGFDWLFGLTGTHLIKQSMTMSSGEAFVYNQILWLIDWFLFQKFYMKLCLFLNVTNDM